LRQESAIFFFLRKLCCFSRERALAGGVECACSELWAERRLDQAGLVDFVVGRRGVLADEVEEEICAAGMAVDEVWVSRCM